MRRQLRLYNHDADPKYKGYVPPPVTIHEATIMYLRLPAYAQLCITSRRSSSNVVRSQAFLHVAFLGVSEFGFQYVDIYAEALARHRSLIAALEDQLSIRHATLQVE